MSKQDALIRDYVRQGYSANRIQRELQRGGLGMQRKRLLTIVRDYRHAKPKPTPEKHVPIKYRQRFPVGAKHIVAYGTYRGESRRVSVLGSGSSLRKLWPLIWRHPPKKQFLMISADELESYPEHYLSMGRWDREPQVES